MKITTFVSILLVIAFFSGMHVESNSNKAHASASAKPTPKCP